MENKSHALAAGIFVLALSALMVLMAVWLMRDSSEQRVYEISTSLSVTGLQLQAGVRYKGVPVGRVTSIGLDTTSRGNVLIRLALNAQVPVSTSTVASLGYQGVTGLAFVQLDDGGVLGGALQGSPGHAARIPLQPGTLARWTDQGEHVLAKMQQASARIDALLAPDNQKDLMQAVNNLSQAAASLQKLTLHVDQALTVRDGQAGMDLPGLATQMTASFKTMQVTAEHLATTAEAVSSSAAEFRKVSVRMNEPDGTLDRIARTTDALRNVSQTLTMNLVPRLNRTADEATRAARQVGVLAEGVTDNPSSLLFGKGPAAPGPGEPGFVAPSIR